MQAARLLEQVVELLRGQSTSNDNTAQLPTSNVTIPVSDGPLEIPAANAVPPSSNTSTQARQNASQASLSRLFQPYRFTRVQGTGSRRPRVTTMPWEHDFFCLAEPGQTTVPNIQETQDLQRRGLGRKRILFRDNQGSHLDFANRLYEVYPSLKNGGGFKLMRCCRSRQLVELPMPLDGYSFQFLRFNSGLNRAVAYIVPLQSKLRLDEDVPVIADELVVKELCQHCHLQVPLQVMELHSISCGQSTALQPTVGGQETTAVQPVTIVHLRVGLLLYPEMATYSQQRAKPIQKIQVPLNNNETSLISALRRTFPKLGNKPFEMCRVDAHRNIHVLDLPKKSSIALRATMKYARSAVYIRPKEKLDETSEEDDSDLDEGDAEHASVSPGSHNEGSATSSSVSSVSEADSLNEESEAATQSSSESDNLNEEQELDESEWINAGTPDIFFRVSRAHQQDNALCSTDEDTSAMESEEQNQQDEEYNRVLGIDREVEFIDSSDNEQSDHAEMPSDGVEQFTSETATRESLGNVSPLSIPAEVFDSTSLNSTNISTVAPLLTASSSNATIANSNTGPDLKGLLETLRSAVAFEEAAPFSNTVNAIRTNILESGLRAFGRRSFNPLRRLDIVFVDTCGYGEGSVDDGGPTREFLRLLMKAILASRFFVGPQDSKSLALDSLGLSKGTYKVLGIMMAVSLVHGGVGPLVLSDRLFAQLSGLPTPAMDVRDVDDPELREVLDKIQNAESLEEVRTAVLDATSMLSLLGALAPIRVMQDRDDLVQSILQFYLEGRQEAALTQLKEGMRVLGVLDEMQMHPAVFKSIFCGGTPPLTAACLMDLFRVDYSPTGSTRRRLEEVAVGQWRDWLIDVEGGDAVTESEVDGGEQLLVSLEDVLVFASGASSIPPFGFSEKPSISFLTEVVNGGRRVYPEANTCDIKLRLPIHDNYEDFSRHMILGLIQSPTFGVS